MARVNLTEQELFFLIAQFENVLESDYDEQLASIQNNLEGVYFRENDNNNNHRNNNNSSVSSNNSMYIGPRRANEEGNLFPGNNRAEGNRRRRKNRRTKKNS